MKSSLRGNYVYWYYLFLSLSRIPQGLMSLQPDENHETSGQRAFVAVGAQCSHNS